MSIALAALAALARQVSNPQKGMAMDGVYSFNGRQSIPMCAEGLIGNCRIFPQQRQGACRKLLFLLSAKQLSSARPAAELAQWVIAD